MENIITALITGGISLIGIIITCAVTGRTQSNEIDAKLDKQQAVTNTKLDELTREVREHNNFARRMPVVEEQIKVVNNRLKTLESYHRPEN